MNDPSRETSTTARSQSTSTESLYADFFELAPIAFLTLDSRGVVLDANRAASELFQLSREELVQTLLVRSSWTMIDRILLFIVLR